MSRRVKNGATAKTNRNATSRRNRRRRSIDAGGRPRNPDPPPPPDGAAPEIGERAHKLLARLGYGSRRSIEDWIRAGRITINGRPAAVGAAVSPGDVVEIDGRRVSVDGDSDPGCRVLLYHKPEGEICTRDDPQGRPTIYAHLPRLRNSRWIAVGRLDINTTGLMLLTTDGEFAHRLMHPTTGIEREYLVRVLGEAGPDIIERLQRGIELDDGRAAFSAVHQMGGRGANHWYRVVLKEGRKREVRRIWEAAGFRVSRLKRIRFGPIELPASVRRGRYLELDDGAIDRLRLAAGMNRGGRRSVPGVR